MPGHEQPLLRFPRHFALRPGFPYRFLAASKLRTSRQALHVQRRPDRFAGKVRPERWTIQMSHELLELLWVLEATIAEKPYGADLLARVVASDLFEAHELPQPSEDEKKPPKG